MLDGPLDLTRAQAARTTIDMGGSAVDDSLDSSHIGLPGPVGPSVGVGNLNTERNALATDIAFCHFSAPPYS